MTTHTAFPFLRTAGICSSILMIAAAQESVSPETSAEVPAVKITANSAGSVRLGMTVAEARNAMEGTKFERSSDGEGIALISVTLEGKEMMLLGAGEIDTASVPDDAAIISFIEISSPEYITQAGVHVGMELSEAVKNYGAVKELVMSELESREFVSFVKQPSGIHFRVGNGSGSAGIYKAGGMVTSDYRPGSKIEKIDITGADIVQDGAIGGISLDTTEEELMEIAEKEGLGALDKGEDEISDGFGEIVQNWVFKESGLSIGMISGETGGKKQVYSITVQEPSNLKTEHGIGIGSPKEDVLKAYSEYSGKSIEPGDLVKEGDSHIIGSLSGSMVFKFEKAKVSGIFLSAAVE